MGVMRMRDERGQMTVELAAAFPVLIIVAVIAVNALFGVVGHVELVAAVVAVAQAFVQIYGE